MTSDLIALAQALLGPDIAVAGGRIADLQDPLWSQEAGLMTRARPARLADFTAGRTAARRALALMGEPPQLILQGPGGEPIWPEGIVGSLTHGGGLCLAALGRSAKFRSAGIDLEPLARLEPALVNEICGPEEQDWIAKQTDAADLPLRIFTAKEATYKALYPLTGTVFGFDALRVSLTPGRDGFTAELTRDIGPFPVGTTLEGGQGIAESICLSTLIIPITPL